MKSILVENTLELPENVTASVKSRCVKIEGPRGSLWRDFSHSRLQIKQKGNIIRVGVWHGNKKINARVRTITSHIRNMISGVTKGYQYKMRLVHAHFPINSTIETKENETRIKIRNFIGQKRIRDVKIADGVSIVKSENVKDELILEGNCIEAVSQSAAAIQQSVLVKNKDIRKFLDGIYVSHKGFVDDK